MFSSEAMSEKLKEKENGESLPETKFNGSFILRRLQKMPLLMPRTIHLEIFAVNSLTSLAATIAVMPSTVSRWGLNSTTSAATTLA